MNRKHHLGELQYAIMDVLWRLGEASGTEVWSALPDVHRRAPTTIATMLTKMERKGVVRHRARGRQFLYAPTITQGDVQRSMVLDLTRRLFDGDATALVAHLIREREIGAADLAELRERIEQRSRASAPETEASEAGRSLRDGRAGR